ncbi:hypothetical protein DSL72_004056 [Monilinia vaccinii-corymbosi]|uniref:Uncharacterized protein n=1 Tax=Monilinia vaccinii-corymbosi TaxID=61207 RepID=A0A8A3P3T0_9HELO|nr:hypothetical protein DSL72_004056 [Monilinia vaccinii-corymbosi]
MENVTSQKSQALLAQKHAHMAVLQTMPLHTSKPQSKAIFRNPPTVSDGTSQVGIRADEGFWG